ncbi:Scr1 family TA system antitoxin-like transcriptional regulator [Streptomyces sp. NBUA17]|uniref:Scr1 family TA system antitoxin-like transcriptional regulator n=1 Tax=Streptomyces sp. NBUA17 TaxID=3062275 RepID=UPI0037D9AFA6
MRDRRSKLCRRPGGVARDARIADEPGIPCIGLIHESALRMQVGGRKVARAQLARLQEEGERDNVTLRVMLDRAELGDLLLPHGSPLPSRMYRAERRRCSSTVGTGTGICFAWGELPTPLAHAVAAAFSFSQDTSRATSPESPGAPLPSAPVKHRPPPEGAGRARRRLTLRGPSATAGLCRGGRAVPAVAGPR